MSAWIVDKAHIDALVTAALDAMPLSGGSPLAWYWPAIDRTTGSMGERHEARWEDATRIGAMLWAENVKSVNYRYSEDEQPPEYRYARRAHGLTAVEVLKSVNCLEYQSCEHPEWESSEAYAFCEALTHRYIGMLPGYDAAPWGISDGQ